VEPQLRASLLRLYLSCIAVRSRDDSAAVRAALGPESVARIERAPGHDWLPMTLEVAILRAIHARHGDEGVRALGREVGHAAIGDGLLGRLLRATVTMLGRRPDVLVHIAIAGWSLATRNACRAAVASRTDGEVRIALEDLPGVMRERIVLLRLGGSTAALLEYGVASAGSELEWAPGSARAELRLWWSRAG
jgi:hypothetical protein